MRHQHSAATVLFALLLSVGPTVADFATATSADDGGYYANVFREWRALAEAGDTDAQIALTGLYHGGIGRDVDLTRSAQWYMWAALADDPVAQLNLAEMYEHGWDVTRNNVATFIWYHHGAAQGRNWPANRRDRLAKRMHAAKLAAAPKWLSKSQCGRLAATAPSLDHCHLPMTQ